MEQDQRGLALSTTSAEAAAAFRTAIDHYFDYRLDTIEYVKAALAADPDFLMGHCLKGYLMMLIGSTRLYPKVDEALADCRRLQHGGTEREVLHVAALDAWRRGDQVQACRIWDQILFANPRDLLALRLQHFALFWRGDAQGLRGRPAQVMPAWDKSVPGYGSLLGMLAFGLEECNDYGPAEDAGRRAVAINPDDLWAIHAVAHVLEMQGRCKEGLEWLDYPLNAWQDRNPFRGHLWWHRALYAHELGDDGRVLELYDRAIRIERSDFYLDIQNAAALLLRLELSGIDVGERWEELADHAEANMNDHFMIFTDLHRLISLVRAGRMRSAELLVESLRAYADGSADSNAEATRTTGLPIARGVLAYGRHDDAGAIEHLLPLRFATAPVGGSHAQRDIFLQVLQDAAIRAHRAGLAQALAGERVTLRPDSAVNKRLLATANGL